MFTAHFQETIDALRFTLHISQTYGNFSTHIFHSSFISGNDHFTSVFRSFLRTKTHHKVSALNSDIGSILSTESSKRLNRTPFTTAQGLSLFTTDGLADESRDANRHS
jgi:hypothetical protein